MSLVGSFPFRPIGALAGLLTPFEAKTIIDPIMMSLLPKQFYFLWQQINRAD
jgi:hypothetical protein